MHAIGVDVGGSKTSIGLVDTVAARILDRLDLPTPAVEETGAPFLARIAGAVRQIAGGRAADLPVGIGICEIVDARGEIVSAHRVDWTTQAARAALDFAGRVTIEADARAAAVAEAIHGAGRGLRRWIYANAGTGIATILMEGTTPYRGAHGRALAGGMGPASFRTESSHPPSVEDLAGGAGMLNRARAAGLPVGRFAELPALDGTAGAAAKDILVEGGSVLGRTLGFLSNALDPEAVVLGGGIARASADYVAACERAFRATIWFRDAELPPIRLASLGSDSGLIGGAMVGAAPA